MGKDVPARYAKEERIYCPRNTRKDAITRKEFWSANNANERELNSTRSGVLTPLLRKGGELKKQFAAISVIRGPNSAFLFRVLSRISRANSYLRR